MKVTLYTVTSSPFCQQAKDYLTSKGVAFEEKNVETNRDFLAEMQAASDNFNGVPVTKVETDSGQVHVLKGFTQAEFDQALTTSSPVMQAQDGGDAPTPTPPSDTPPAPEPTTPTPLPTPSEPPVPVEMPPAEPTPPPPPMPEPEPPVVQEPTTPPTMPTEPPTNNEPQPGPTVSAQSTVQPSANDAALDAILKNLQSKAATETPAAPSAQPQTPQPSATPQI